MTADAPKSVGRALDTTPALCAVLLISEIYALIERLADEGTAILLVSSELPEVMRQGRPAGELKLGTDRDCLGGHRWHEPVRRSRQHRRSLAGSIAGLYAAKMFLDRLGRRE
jgi:hypothetical protein